MPKRKPKPRAGRKIRVTVTSDTKRLEKIDSLQWRRDVDGAAKNSADTVIIDTKTRYQTVLGFGAFFSDAACDSFDRMCASNRAEVFRRLFGESKLGLSVGRTFINAIDFDRERVLSILRQVKAVNPEMFFFGSVCSLRDVKLDATRARHIAELVKEYADNGVHIDALTVGGEACEDGGDPSWLPESREVDFARDYLVPALEKAGLQTQVWMIDDQTNLWTRSHAMLDYQSIVRYSPDFGWHASIGDAQSIPVVHDGQPAHDDSVDGDHSHDANLDWTNWGRAFTGDLRNWCRTITARNVEQFAYSGQYYALAHFSKFVKRGAVRVQSSADLCDLDQVVFRNVDGKTVAVITNACATARSVTLAWSGLAADVHLEANSVTTLVW